MPRAFGAKSSHRKSGLSQISRLHDSRSLPRLGVEKIGVVPLKPVGDEQHRCALPKDTARPIRVEPVQCRADAGAPVPIPRFLPDRLQRRVDVALVQRPRDVGEPGAEGEGVHMAQRVASVPRESVQ